ncbi:hypothetical protein HXX76_016061 [Chlamydomonas incerta]|uniref:ATP-grasp domain-containing protein n=1 Tax=Chlamydomonas incerta TaxID=51695 RepID=A0A835SB98_CHLIN|nr:hypothetical protein HXX76_016061 [Chlamydomonas incerta]|eukprot:KAG2422416.1 hypothetical protein HXX76_016061 [Chlamydomonas incerta]
MLGNAEAGATVGAAAVHEPLSGALVNEPHRKLRVCVLQPSLEGSCSVFKDVDAFVKPEVHDPHGRYEWSEAFLRKATSVAQLLELLVPGVAGQQGGGGGAKAAPDVFLNLCDGAWDEDRAGKEVIEALERLNMPYTGANAAFYEPSKIEMKMAAHYYGVKVPAWVHIQPGVGRRGVEAGLESVLAPPSHGGLRFPLIVKHPSGYGSVGMSKDSKVHNAEQLRVQVAHCVNSFGGALVEEFIGGREFTVLVVEEPGPAAGDCGDTDPDLTSFHPVAYTPVECAFGPGEDFKHFDIKWTDYGSMSWRPCTDPELSERLKAAARDTFLATRGISYGRCDFRVDAAGDIYLLEINPNCGVLDPPEALLTGCASSADYILSLDPEHNHAHFLATIFATAISRHRLRQPKVAVQFFRSPPRITAQPQHQAQERQSNALEEEEAPRTPTCEAAAASAAAAAAATAAAAALALEDQLDNGVANATASSGSDSSGSNSSTASGASSPSRHSTGSGASEAITAANGEPVTGGKHPQAAAAAAGPAGHAAPEGGGAGGWGLVALVPIRAGEVVQRNEQRPAVLASSGFVKRSWPAGSRQREWFDAYAYPIGDEVFVTWSDDPTSWAPLNHSCDPNCWLRGLDLLARRDIAPDEQITADYATFCAGPNVAAFDCDCGAGCCRRRVTGADYLQPWVGERFGQHVSPFVAAARKRAGLA